ncbi:hypothetical protein SELMODRAFT_172144 [Selaginella moellendorffii]|uniref:SMP domain-containing protein n=1 Tax=Selaginella moellendorffii TaxID=88036 RepID=D8RK55_SELML|nr:late embryogenesis abundant protein D-34 [Selaginella moellendorffii]XP_024532016.1 late embryogenesis abundant protein D-34 [Selaginella moellendorffii]EFJ27387.1 hypothetical protein SELMODRAFT_172144 [Selaginella moellendorffii]|eukprot:XP_002971638.1 late embryogenesis abundant protein D-34 [Selaginella moellendorffii]
MSQEQMQRPVTYGDIFNVSGEMGKQAITSEDAALMQSAETQAFGQTQKHGAASLMQAAADHNVKTGALSADAHSPVADIGVTVRETVVPGAAIDTEFVANVPVTGVIRPLPTAPEVASANAVTIGEALEAAALGAIDQPIEHSDACAIQSAETRATGAPVTSKGGLSSTAQSAAELNPRVDDFAKTTIGDLLTDATTYLATDKVVTQEDAIKVIEAEARHTPTGLPRPGGVGAAMQTAADLNERAGLLPPSTV